MRLIDRRLTGATTICLVVVLAVVMTPPEGTRLKFLATERAHTIAVPVVPWRPQPNPPNS